MSRVLLLLVLVLVVLGGGTREVEADAGPGPGPPIWPKRGQLDHQLYDKAMRIQSRMWWHLSPEGLLAEIHRPNATDAQLSHDTLQLNDAAIWTGCYAASQAARWHVTKDPDALAQVRHLARGLKTLTEVTGVQGCLVRSVGRPIPGERVDDGTYASKTMEGLRFRSDVSRDQLAGVTLGWWAIARWVDDPELQKDAAWQMGVIAGRLLKDGMWLRDHAGNKTKHGELRPDVEYMPMVRNGPLASIGLGTLLTAWGLNPKTKWLGEAVWRFTDAGDWDDALSEQLTFVRGIQTSSNANMVTLALTTLAYSKHGNCRHRARMGMRALRQATRGWWNAGLCSCFLLAKSGANEHELRGEIRATLHAMPEEDTVPTPVQRWTERKIVPIQHRSIVSGWAWKEGANLYAHPQPGARPSTKVMHTRADFLFAYWFARAAGTLQPRTGPGADPTTPCTMNYPPWRTEGRAPVGFGARPPR